MTNISPTEGRILINALRIYQHSKGIHRQVAGQRAKDLGYEFNFSPQYRRIVNPGREMHPAFRALFRHANIKGQRTPHNTSVIATKRLVRALLAYKGPYRSFMRALAALISQDF